MGRIHLLDENTINHIAAGEVVERPASVVKELVENAIDAYATRITVEIREGGIGFLRVTDNGTGFFSEDLPNAFLRHATSKIGDVRDLEGILSLGFRGEALASIAAVSQVEVLTKTEGELTGTRYALEGGRETAKEPIAAPQGTTFIARNLFYNTPARRKFLKSAKAEAGAVSDVLERLALSRPEIAFKLVSDGRARFQTSGSGRLREAILEVYGIQYAQDLLAVDCTSSGQTAIRVSGYVGRPSLARGNRAYEHFFLHGRHIRSPLLEKALEDALASQMMTGRFPFCVLHLEADMKTVDVNVHPSKLEVRFHDEPGVYDAVARALRQAVAGSEQIPHIAEVRKAGTEAAAPSLAPSRPSAPQPFAAYEPPAAYEETEAAEPSEEVFVPLVFEKDAASHEPLMEAPKEAREVPDYLAGEQIDYKKDLFLEQGAVEAHKVVGQLFDTYWVVELEEKFYIIDQHAAHEKVLYEELLGKLEDRQVYSQGLAVPLVVSLTASEYERYLEHAALFSELGYAIEPFGGTDLAIKGVPYIFNHTIGEEDFILILDSLSGRLSPDRHDSLLHEAADMSCKAAIKANDRLSETEYRHLVQRLMTLEDPFHCPHGRPVIVAMTLHELEKKFKRIV